MISEDFVEAANMSCIDAPPSVSEWALTGLQKAKSSLIKPARVAESLFAIEASSASRMFDALKLTYPSDPPVQAYRLQATQQYRRPADGWLRRARGCHVSRELLQLPLLWSTSIQVPCHPS